MYYIFTNNQYITYIPTKKYIKQYNQAIHTSLAKPLCVVINSSTFNIRILTYLIDL
jgi:hypothetical protein